MNDSANTCGAIAQPMVDALLPANGGGDGTPRIILAEDNTACRHLIASMLRALGYRIWDVEDGLEALELVQALGTDLLITDLLMPRMDGLELIMRLQLHAPWVPVIAITGAGDAESHLYSAKERGAVEVLAKPIEAVELAAAVRRALGPIGDGTPGSC